MTVTEARTWLITLSLAITGLIFVFFGIAPVIGYPLTYPEAIRLLEIVLPVFIGYLGSATQFVFSPSSQQPDLRTSADATQLGLLVKGPIIVWGAGSFAVIAAFGFSNRLSAAPGDTRMSLDALAGLLTAGLSLLTVTTSVAIAYLFGQMERTRDASTKADQPVARAPG